MQITKMIINQSTHGFPYGVIPRWLFLLLFCFCYSYGQGQTATEAANALAKMGFENVSWSENDAERIYMIQNSAYRLEAQGISRAVEVIQAMGLPCRKPCRIIVLSNNIPQISLLYTPRTINAETETNIQDWKVSYDLGKNWKETRKSTRLNSSLYKVDITVYPELSLKNLVITQIYQILFNLSPAIEVSIWPGMKLTAQVVIPVYNDGYPFMYDKVHPGFLSLSQTVRLPHNFWTTLTVGTFTGNRYGADLQLLHRFKDERFTAFGRVGYTGTGYWDGFMWNYGTKMRTTWSLGGSFYLPRYNVETSLKVEQYILKERGVRVDVIRHFRYASIGFYAMKAEGIRANGGFRFQIALPPYKYKRKGYIPRVTPANNMGMAYNAGNEQYYYKTYRTMPSDNIMLNNSLNPYFIKSELLNH